MGIGTLRRHHRQKAAPAPQPEPAPEEVIQDSGEQGAARDSDGGTGAGPNVSNPYPVYRVEQSGTWHKLIGPDGVQVGKAQRSEEAAWAEMEAE